MEQARVPIRLLAALMMVITGQERVGVVVPSLLPDFRCRANTSIAVPTSPFSPALGYVGYWRHARVILRRKGNSLVTSAGISTDFLITSLKYTAIPCDVVRFFLEDTPCYPTHCSVCSPWSSWFRWSPCHAKDSSGEGSSGIGEELPTTCF